MPLPQRLPTRGCKRLDESFLKTLSRLPVGRRNDYGWLFSKIGGSLLGRIGLPLGILFYTNLSSAKIFKELRRFRERHISERGLRADC